MKRSASFQPDATRRPIAHRLAATMLMLGLAPGVWAADEGAAGTEPLAVMASFSIMQDLVRQVGGDRVKVETLVPAGADTHVYQPGPAQARQLAASKLVIINGLGFEGWLPRLIRSSGYKGPVIEAAQGIRTLAASDDHGHSHDHDDDHEDEHDHDEADTHDDDHDHDKAEGHSHSHAKSAGESSRDDHGHEHAHAGMRDPHAWQDVFNVRRYVANIAQALCEAAPADCEGFRQRARAYDKQLVLLDRQIHQAIEAVPRERRRVMVSHAAFGYYAKAYKLEFLAPVGVSTEAEPSAATVGKLIREAREKEVKAFFFENNSDPRLLQRMASELKDIRIGELYADSLSKASGPAPDYLSMMRFNTTAITRALLGQPAPAAK